MKWTKYIFLKIAKYFGFDFIKENKELQELVLTQQKRIAELEKIVLSQKKEKTINNSSITPNNLPRSYDTNTII